MSSAGTAPHPPPFILGVGVSSGAVVVLQKTWDEQQQKEDLGLREFLKEQKITTATRSCEEILNMSLGSIRVPFCDVDLIQEVLAVNRLQYEVPPTYPPELRHLFRRKIKRRKAKNVLTAATGEFPAFVKPVKRSKWCFDGFVIQDKCAVAHFLNVISSLGEIVYFCEAVQFVSEFRLFIQNRQVVGYVDISADVIAREDRVSDLSIQPPASFVRDVLAAIPRTKSWTFCVVDVGQIQDTGKWAVVEVHPPFAVSSYDWPLDRYFKYCQSAWQYILFSCSDLSKG